MCPPPRAANRRVRRARFRPRPVRADSAHCAAWLDRRDVDDYYRVRPQEARAQRLPYRADPTVNVEAGLRAAYRVVQRQSVPVSWGGLSIPSVCRAQRGMLGTG
ncbi:MULTISPECIES: MipA/OmpV family protein [unclassified Xanthomonas]|uniref:MipA/OmpV family protein n=1 Tax=Xanthomonas sp. LMG 8992 TaxID=1591157 RepID=UPI0034E09A13